MKANMDYETLRGSMTVQDAIQVLKDTNCYGTMDIAKNVILKALEEQSSEHTEERTEMHACDCISRKAVIDTLHSKFADGFDSDKWWNSTYVLDAINEAPSVTPQPKTGQQKTGHWIGERKIGSEWKDVTVYVNSEGNVMESVRCSECDEWLTGSDEYICGARYCPMCGAKMESEVQK